MYRVVCENLQPDEIAAVKTIVPHTLNLAASFALSIGDGVIQYCFGNDALPGQRCFNEFDAKRKKMDDYLNRKCDVLTFKGRSLDNVPQGAYAYMRHCCWHAEAGTQTTFRSAGGSGASLESQSDFLPSGTRVHLFAANFMKLTADGKFNTIAHEVTHRVIATSDSPDGTSVYGWSAARALRDKSSALALQCAENWGYFYENVADRLPAITK